MKMQTKHSHRNFITLFFFCFLWGINAQIPLRPITQASEKQTHWVGRVYLKIKPEAHSSPLSMAALQSADKTYFALKQSLLKAHVVAIKQPFLSLKTKDWAAVYDIQLGDEKETTAFIKTVSAFDYIEYAEPIPIMRQTYTPNDPQYSNQYHLSKIKANNAWNTHRGGGAIVAIVDDAVRITHEDLASNIWVNPNEIPDNGIDDDNNGYIDDINGYDVASDDNDPMPGSNASNSSFTHGTHCAGIAGAVSDNGIGVASIGFNNKIMAVKTINSGNGTLSHTFEGVAYAIAAGANVISMSWGGGFAQTGQALFNTAYANGIVCIAAAGNDNTSQMAYPAAYNHVISVAATDQNDTRASFSNYGTWVDVSAPGVNILSTLAGSDNAYGLLSGTSMACPLVAGLAGLIRSRNPNFTPDQVENCLKAFTDNIDTQNPNYIGQLGTGRINAEGAIQCSGTCSSPINVSPITITNFNTTTIEAGNTVTFATNATNATSFAWTVGGETTAFSTNPTTVSRTFNTQGSYRIFYTASNANPLCRQQAYLDVTITCSIDVNFSAPTSTTINAPLSITNTSNNPNNISYQWYIDGIPVSAPPTILTYAGVYQLELRATNGTCTVSKQQTIKAFEPNSLSYMTKVGVFASQILPLADGSTLVIAPNILTNLSKSGTKNWQRWAGTQTPYPFDKRIGVAKSNGNVLIVQSESKSVLSSSNYDCILFFDIDPTTGTVVPNTTHRFVGSNANYYPRYVFKQNDNYVIIGMSNLLPANSGTENDVPNLFMLCIDANGNKVWEKTWQTPNDIDRLHNAIQTSDGGFLLSGNIGTVTPVSLSYFVLKTDANGQVIWYRPFYSSHINGGMSGWGSGGIHSAVETCDAYYLMSSTPSVLFKLNKNGEFNFIKEYQTSSGHLVTSMVADADGNLTTFAVSPTNGNDGDAYLFNINTQGTVNWSRQYNDLGTYAPLGTFNSNLGMLVQTGDNGYLMSFVNFFNGLIEGSTFLRSDKNGLIECLPSASLPITVEDKTAFWNINTQTFIAPNTNNLSNFSNNAVPSSSYSTVTEICPASIACNGLNVSIYLPKTTGRTLISKEMHIMNGTEYIPFENTLTNDGFYTLRFFQNNELIGVKSFVVKQ